MEKLAARRIALLAQDSDRELSGQGQAYVGRRVHSLTETDARTRNLVLTTDALDHAGLDYFLVPGRSQLRHVVGLRFAARKSFLTALRELYATTALYALTPTKDHWPTEAALYADGALSASLKRQDTIRFGEILLGPEDQILADLTQGCDVEFWRDGQALLAKATEPRTAERLA